MNILQKALGYGAGIAPPPRLLARGYLVPVERGSHHLPTLSQFDNCPPPHSRCLAIQYGHVDIVEFLIKRGCNVNMRNPEGLTLLCLAVIHGDANLVRSLLSRGAREERRHEGAKEAVDLLLHYDSDSTWPTTLHIQYAIQCALVERQGDILPPLLATGVSLNHVIRDCRAPGIYTPRVWAVD
jgi:hypothetical protein